MLERPDSRVTVDFSRVVKSSGGFISQQQQHPAASRWIVEMIAGPWRQERALLGAAPQWFLGDGSASGVKVCHVRPNPCAYASARGCRACRYPSAIRFPSRVVISVLSCCMSSMHAHGHSRLATGHDTVTPAALELLIAQGRRYFYCAMDKLGEITAAERWGPSTA